MNDILTILKEEYIADKSYIKSVKQLDFYMNRAKTETDKSTIKFFNHFCENHELGTLVNKELTEADKKLVEDYLQNFEQIKQQKAESVSVKNDDYIASFVDYYSKKSTEMDLVKQPASSVFNLSLVYNMPRSYERIYSGCNVDHLSNAQYDKNYATAIFYPEMTLKKEFGVDITKLSKLDAEIAIFKQKKYIDKDAKEGQNKFITKEEFEKRQANGENVEEALITKKHPVYHFDKIPAEIRTEKLEADYLSTPEYKRHVHLKELVAKGQAEDFFEETANECIGDLFKAMDALDIRYIEHENNECYYTPARHSISMPPRERFASSMVYASVLAHELTHATAHKEINNRKLCGLKNSKNYGFEEIVAQSGSELLLRKYGLPSTIDHESAKYIKGYLDSLSTSENKRLELLQAAAGQASKAVDVIEKGVKGEVKLTIQPDIIRENKVELNNHVVSFGETLEEISRAHLGHSLDLVEIAKATDWMIKENNIKKPELLLSGQVLKVPSPEIVKNHEIREFYFTKSTDLYNEKVILPPTINSTDAAWKIIDKFLLEINKDKYDEVASTIAGKIDEIRENTMFFNISNKEFSAFVEQAIADSHKVEAVIEQEVEVKKPSRGSSLTM